MPNGGSSRSQLLANLIGKTVADQANAGFLQSWKRSDLYRSIVNDEKMFDFVELMAQINDEDMDEQMQAFYTAVQSYNADVGHVDNVAKIQECLDLAVEALAVEKVSVEAVMKIRQAVWVDKLFRRSPPKPRPKKSLKRQICQSSSESAGTLFRRRTSSNR